MTQQDDRGFSLVELIIVMAIMAVLLAVTFYGISSLSGRQVSECVNHLETYLGKTRAYSLAYAQGDVHMEFYRTADGYFVTTTRNGVVDEERRIGNASLKVSYHTGAGVGAGTEMAVGTSLTFSFKRDSGGFDTSGGTPFCNQLTVSKGGTTTSLILVEKTGMYYTQ